MNSKDLSDQKRGMYTPQLEHDACGIGLIGNLNGEKSHQVVSDVLYMLENMEHRGGKGCDPETGDGAGILLQIPDGFLRKESEQFGFTLPEPGKYGIGVFFFPKDKEKRIACRTILEENIRLLNLELLGYRYVPVDNSVPGPDASATEPVIEHVFVKARDENMDQDTLERKLFVMRNHTTHRVNAEVEDDVFYVASFSTKTIVYKGQLRTDQLRRYFLDLDDETMETSLALVHSRFSTNTFPNWKLAQPFRYIAHNGEINTIRGNVNKMKSKVTLFKSRYFNAEEMQMLIPFTNKDYSDSANLDALVEVLTLAGRSLPHVMMMLVPEAWQGNDLMDPQRKSFYKFHASLMEPWDGPAALVFTDGNLIGATLDRNGLRPLRYTVTHSGKIIIASEAGVLPIDVKDVKEKGRITPGKILMADLRQGKVMYDEEVKESVYKDKNYYEWIAENRAKIPVLKDYKNTWHPETLLQKQQVFGYSDEDKKVILTPMAEKGHEPLGSMGDDTPLAVLSRESKHISNYFKQHFAQVSNPPIDPIRERNVMSLFTRVGASLNILEESPAHTHQVHIAQPVIFNSDMEKLKLMKEQGFDWQIIDSLFIADGKPGRLEEGLDLLCETAEKAVRSGKRVLIISDKNIDDIHAPIPSLLAIGAVQHHLIEKSIRPHAGLVIEAGDVWEVHHFATIIGYGASAINPYMAMETLHAMNNEGLINGELSDEQVFENYRKAIGKGLLKVMSKMGISTLQSYQGSQIFEALGLSSQVINKCFRNTISRIEGLSFDDLARETLSRHEVAFKKKSTVLPVGGIYSWKRRGEKHLFNPETIHLLQHSTKSNNFDVYKKYAEKINNQTRDNFTLRGLFDFKERKPVALDEVEPVENILKRFATGAMSFGSISHEAHSTLAIAMNRIGGKSNSGEGGEDEIRFFPKENGDWERSAIKQVASGRFGVTSYYLTNAIELQIKMAQGAKPGEGGQLPGHKVDEWIGRVRHSTPGVGLISPPPHHDIYSIEDLAQLIFDLKNANKQARINVKLVSQAGVGTVAAGVAKAKADAILISGADGGTGASPISSMRHAGLPWELGLSEAHQTLVKNKLRSRIVLQTDGQIRTGRDIAIAALLGAEEWGVATAALVVEGCIMMRKCHLNTCPVGIATQDPELRRLFTGNPDHVVNFFSFLAMDLREHMARLGFKTVNEMVGHAELLKVREDLDHWKIKTLDLSPVLYREPLSDITGVHKQIDQDFGLEEVLDRKLIEIAQPALEKQVPVRDEFFIHNTDRSLGAMLSNEVSKRYLGKGLADDTIHYKFRGSAGQSFGLFTAPGITLELEGESNDYFGKGLSGGRLIIYPDREASFRSEENIIVGNVAFYGATSGEAYISGMAGERFCVRNSGVNAVVEGVGDHACEYMTGGRVVILGDTGKNFAAGMSGGIAYVFDPRSRLHGRHNREMVDLEILNDEDKDLVFEMVENHVSFTNSRRGALILRNWDETIEMFIKVMPREYNAVLMKLKEQQQAKNVA